MEKTDYEVLLISRREIVRKLESPTNDRLRNLAQAELDAIDVELDTMEKIYA